MLVWCELWEIVGRIFIIFEDKCKDFWVCCFIVDMKDKIVGDYMIWYVIVGSGGVGFFLNVIFM